MAEMLEKHEPPQRVADGSSRLLESGYYATPGMFRDIDEFTCPCILNREDDMAKMKAYLDEKKSYDGLVINVPEKYARATEERPGWLPKHLGIASEQFYDQYLGFVTEQEKAN
jgi:CRISPR-associated endonuclease/helicase Cas3